MRSAREGNAFAESRGTKRRQRDSSVICERAAPWNGYPRSAFLFRLETRQEYTMPYLFWAVLPFALMDTWWGMCEQRRDTQ